MLNKKRQGFTLMEIVLVMVLIAILATGVAIGFTSYINRGHESGITTDFNSTFKNPVRMEAIEKGRIAEVKDIAEKTVDDGFVHVFAGASNWSGDVLATDGTFTTAPTLNAASDALADTAIAYVEKGNKRYQILVGFSDGTNFNSGATASGTERAAILVEADHSSSDSAVVYVLNAAKNDVETVLGTYDSTGFTVAD